MISKRQKTFRLFFIFCFVFCIPCYLISQNSLSFERTSGHAMLIVDPDFHETFGLRYPVTVEVTLPYESTDLHVVVKDAPAGEWVLLNDLADSVGFQGIDGVRFDYAFNRAYLSITFDEDSDTLCFDVRTPSGATADWYYSGICKYYDNRDAAVTASADDWADWSMRPFIDTILEFRKRKLWLTCGIITNGVSDDSWPAIQYHVRAGYVEAAAHSRSHPPARPYQNIESETAGCREDILSNLELPHAFRKGDKEYLYVWIAPNGYVDDQINRSLAENDYLVNRLYETGSEGLAHWNWDLSMYDPYGVTLEMGPLWLGITNVPRLNARFDQVVKEGGVYHLMCHPNIVDWEELYPHRHLDYISMHDNVWYVALGHLYVYHTMYRNQPDAEISPYTVPDHYSVGQNYPNPFNGETHIPYELPEPGEVDLQIYDSIGRLVFNESRSHRSAGAYTITWPAENRSSGLYLYRIIVSGKPFTGKMLLVK